MGKTRFLPIMREVIASNDWQCELCQKLIPRGTKCIKAGSIRYCQECITKELKHKEAK